jgi:hypothetical protein
MGHPSPWLLPGHALGDDPRLVSHSHEGDDTWRLAGVHERCSLIADARGDLLDGRDLRGDAGRRRVTPIGSVARKNQTSTDFKLSIRFRVGRTDHA